MFYRNFEKLIVISDNFGPQVTLSQSYLVSGVVYSVPSEYIFYYMHLEIYFNHSGLEMGLNFLKSNARNL